MSDVAPDRIWTNCVCCGRIVDTREVTEGGDVFGCQLKSEEWVCSVECYDLATLTAERDALRNEVLEEAAMVVEEEAKQYDFDWRTDELVTELAAALRAKKEMGND